MKPAEKFNNNVWYILQKIREKSFYSPKKGFISYDVYDPISDNLISESCPSSKEELLILEKLSGWKAIKLYRPTGNEMFESIEILQPKFDETYNKVKNHFYPPKKVIPEEVIEWLRIPPLIDKGEELISDLYKNAKKSQRSCKIYLGAIDDINENLIEVLNDLKKRKLISYKTEAKVVDSYTESGGIIPYDIIEAEIKFNPEKLINYIKKPWETKKIIVEKLARHYLNLIRAIEAYFKNPQKLDNALNKSYENLCEEIRVLIYENNISSRLEFLYKKPFNLLFSAEKELEKDKITLKDKINSLRDFYGEIQKLLLIYDVSDKQSDEISKIENYLAEIESEGKIKEKELNLDNLDFHQALFLLRIIYKKLVEILEAFCGGYFASRNEVINYYYVSFKETINQILEMKGFEELKKETPELFESLIGDIEESDMDWEYGYSKQAYAFLGKIENLFIKSGAKSFKLPRVLENKMQETDKAIVAHKEYDKKLWERTEKSLDKMKKDFDWDDSSKKVGESLQSHPERTNNEATPIRIIEMPELKIKELEKLSQKKKEQTKETTLFLNQNGDLYKEPKEGHCYPMSESEGRHKIVRYFVENKIYSYYPTRELATALEKDEISLMKEIGKINTIIQTKLKLKDKILDGKRGSGYRINPKYKIILKNE